MVEGETLADRLKKDLLPLAEVLTISLQIAEALQAAHKKGIIHRDLKPANIKITSEGQVKVLDFGLAKQFTIEGKEADSQTATLKESISDTGMILGTPAYMSPEQAVGDAADARSDIFSYGAVIYEMLTGRRTFSGNTIAALLTAVLTDNPPSPRRLRREIPLELDQTIMKALRKDRDQRQKSMEEICSELKRLSAKLNAQPSWLATSLIEPLRNVTWRLGAWGVESRKTALAAGALLVLVILGVVGWQVFRGRAVPDASLPPYSIRVDRDAGAYELFQEGLAYLERYDKEENIEAAFQAFNTALSKDQNYAPAYAGLGMAYAAMFQFNRDKSLLDLAVQNARRAVEIDDHVAVNRVSLGRAFLARGEYELAESELRQALILDPLNADVHRGLADLQRVKGNGAEAEGLYKKAIELRQGDWNLRYALGVFYYRQSRFDEAEKTFNEVVNMAPDIHMAHRDLGAVYHMQGRFAEASAKFQTALQIRPSATTYSNLGTSLFFQGLYQKSVAAFEKAIELGANNYQIWANLGDAYRQTPGSEEKAREAFRAAIQLARDELSGKPGDGELRSQLALYLAKSGEKQEALDQAAQTVTRDISAEVLAALVLVYEICGRREQALDALAAALKKGYSIEEFSRDPELLEMRKDPKYRKLLVKLSN
jgi:serine/threonine-protein kinase